LRLQSEDVAEFNYRPAACRHEYRMVVVRKNISYVPTLARSDYPSITERCAISATIDVA
jgi:hypothetical protein